MPILDNGVVLVAVLLAFVAGAAVVGALLRKRVSPDLLAEIAAVAASIRAQVGETVTEERVKLFAGVLYDQWGHGSQYVSRERFCDLVWDYVQRSLAVDADAVLALPFVIGDGE